MRRNGFGDAYCHTADEVRRIVDNHNNGWEIYLASIEPPEGRDKATAEVVENGSGELVCYIEADTVEAVKAIASELRIETV